MATGSRTRTRETDAYAVIPCVVTFQKVNGINVTSRKKRITKFSIRERPSTWPEKTTRISRNEALESARRLAFTPQREASNVAFNAALGLCAAQAETIDRHANVAATPPPR